MIEFSEEALAAITAIHEFGGREYGILRARQFKQGLYTRIELAEQFPHAGLDCGRIRPGMRRVVFAPYLIYYERTARGIRVINIVHGRSNPAGHIP